MRDYVTSAEQRPLWLQAVITGTLNIEFAYIFKQIFKISIQNKIRIKARFHQLA